MHDVEYYIMFAIRIESSMVNGKSIKSDSL